MAAVSSHANSEHLLDWNTTSLAAIIEQSTSGSLLAADEHVGDDDPVSEIIMLAKANKGVVTYRQQLKSPQASGCDMRLSTSRLTVKVRTTYATVRRWVATHGTSSERRLRCESYSTRDAYTSSSSQPRITAPTCSPKRSTINPSLATEAT